MFDPGAMLSRSYPLPRGPRVRLRLPQSGDAAALRSLSNGEHGELELARLVHLDPRRRLVICATALVDGGPRVLGVGAIGLDAADAEPTLVLSDHELTDGLDELLREALIGRARALARARAA